LDRHAGDEDRRRAPDTDRIDRRPGGQVQHRRAPDEARGDHGTARLRGKADAFSPFRPFTDEERKLLKEELLWIYEQFLTRAAEGRGLTRDAVDAVGKGRIWTGRQAKDLKLVDEIGGLTMAIGLAKKEAGISADEDVRLDVWPRKRSLWQSLAGRPGLGLDLKSATGREKILETARMMKQTKIWAIMPFWVRPQ